MEIYNASKERFRIQCDSKVIDFAPSSKATLVSGKISTTSIPDVLIPFIMKQIKGMGCFIVSPDMPEDVFKHEKLKALKEYREGALATRIRNYVSEQDDYKKKGVTYLGDKGYDRALKWDGELKQLLKDNSFEDLDESFLDDVVATSAMPKEEIEVVKQRGRPRKDAEVAA